MPNEGVHFANVSPNRHMDDASPNLDSKNVNNLLKIDESAVSMDNSSSPTLSNNRPNMEMPKRYGKKKSEHFLCER